MSARSESEVKRSAEARVHPALASRSKRLVDIAVSGSMLLVLSPLFLLIMVLVRLTSTGPAFFRQERVGTHGRPVVVLKFRTMKIGNDDHAHREMNVRELLGEEASTSDGVFKLEGDDRVTAVGSWLRRLSLDELPQLVNVFRGEMSMVGPRPALDWEVALFQPHHLGRLEVRPGITGLWQVSGRNRLSMLEMLDLDLRYVEEWSMSLDLRILARTPVVLIRGDGAR